MRVVLIARMLSVGGAERQFVALAKGLHSRRCDVHVVLFYGGGDLEAELAEAGVPIYCLEKAGRWDLFSFVARFQRALGRLEPSVVYSFLDLPNILSALFWPMMGRPRLVWSIRAAGVEMEHYDWLTRSASCLEARLSGRASWVIANSHAGAAWAHERGFPYGRISVVENGIDTERFQPDPAGRARVRSEWDVGDDEILVGLTGRLDAMKDHPNFLQACAALLVSRPFLKFACIGSGPAAYHAELVALAESLGIGSRLIWTGPRSDMPAVYSALDVACSASAFGEGFSNAVGEAMACGVPCVVTDVGDSSRIVGNCGEVVPPRNASRLAAAIGVMLDRLCCEADLKQRCRARIETNFSVASMVTSTERILMENG